MVRTKADSAGHSTGSYRKAVAARAPRKSFGATASSSSNVTSPSGKKSEGKYAGGNPVCIRPTPKWQKGIGDFFGGPSIISEKENRIPSEDEEEAGGSGVKKAPRKSRPLPEDNDSDEE
ncbi:PCNA-associated factor [Phyllobates terribilis]|uniref:PCNA-associated factor n=1 Tax=Phyllobates terribilis TaxID=111132 RepID=UPI003CCB667D